MDFSWLWLWDKPTYLRECKKFGRPLTIAEREAEMENEGDSGLKPFPNNVTPLTVYREQVGRVYFYILLIYDMVSW